jgi:hypothetical protein
VVRLETSDLFRTSLIPCKFRYSCLCVT